MSERKPFGRLHAPAPRCKEGRNWQSKVKFAEDDLAGAARRLARRPESARLREVLDQRRATRDSHREGFKAHLIECQTCTDAEAATP